MKSKSCLFVILLGLFLFCAQGCAFCQEHGCLLGINATPAALYQGGVAKVELRAASGCLLKRVSFSNVMVPYKRLRNGCYMVLVGAGLKERPREERLAFCFVKKGVSSVVPWHIRVKAKRYKTEYLRVPEKMVSFPPRILKRVLDDQKAIRRACSRIRPVIYWKGAFIWPVRSKILSPFGLRRFFNGEPRSPHSGVDIRAMENTPIKSPNAARVALVRDCYLSGKTVVLDHGGGLFTLYAHLSRVLVRKGQMVKKGQIIGLSGATGRVTGPHLHWGVSLLGKRVDPVALMALLGENG